MSNNRSTRPSPSLSATLCQPGTQMQGNDGNYWTVVRNVDGVHRWVKSAGVAPSQPRYSPPPTTPATVAGIPIDDVDQVSRPSNKSHQFNLSSMSRNSAKKTQDVRKIETSLINKEEVFRTLGLAEATGLPCLLVGAPGVGKTKTVIDYAKAWLNKDGRLSAKEFQEKIYILETDEGTKPSEIKGMPDIQALFVDNKFELSTPIAEAEIVIINEVDKASPAIRNALLGVMNEKFLFNGKHKIPCKWKLFIATCNEIPKEEKDNPFWDRFMLKHTVGRVSAGELVQYYRKGDRNYREDVILHVPNTAEIAAVEISADKLSKYLEVGYSVSSDRTLTFVPKIAKAVSYIWQCSNDQALIKTAQIMINQAAGSLLQDKLITAQKKAIINQIDMLMSYTNNEQLENAIAGIATNMSGYISKGEITQQDVTELEQMIAEKLRTHPARKDFQDNDDFEAQMATADNDAASAMIPF